MSKAVLGTDAHRRKNRRVHVLDGDRVFDRNERSLIRGCAVHLALTDAAAEHNNTGAAGEVTVQAVVVGVLDGRPFMEGLVTRLGAWTAFNHRIAAELTGDDDQGAVQEPAGLEVTNQARNRPIDFLMHLRNHIVALAVRVPLEERHVLRRHFDEAGAILDEATRE